LVSLALLVTLLNGFKPLQVDDAAYYYYASHIAEHPLDPYGFDIHWYQWPHPANHVLAPPVVLYWWAAAIRLFGERPFLWKLWLLPFQLILAVALYRLYQRFARGLERPLVVMTLLSPAILPSVNLMLDVPALALALAAVALFFAACERPHPWAAVGAGLLAGLAMETKYTAFLAPATMVLYGLVSICLTPARDLRGLTPFGIGSKRPTILLSLIAAGVAVSVFVSWEAFVTWRHGQSHFLNEVEDSARNLWEQLEFIVPLFALLGGVAPVTALLALAALGWRGRLIGAVGFLVFVGYALVALFGATITVTVDDSLIPLPHSWHAFPLHLEQIIFSSLGLVVCATLALVAWLLLRVRGGGWWQPTRSRRRLTAWFLVLWLGLELAGYVVLTPFAAVRRILGIIVVASVLAGRLASRTCRAPHGVALVWLVAAVNVLLGLAFYGVDYCDARAAREAADLTVTRIRQQDAEGAIWYVGHWGFQFYAEHAGMKPVVPDRPSHPLELGDWLVVPEERFEQQRISIDPSCLALAGTTAVRDWIPLRTVRCYYGTATGVPLEHHKGARFSVHFYRVIKSFVPMSRE
jgi:hypothetical protein